MKFILLSYAPENAWPPEDHASAIESSKQICHNLASEGKYIHAAPLEPVSGTIHVQVRNGRSTVTDGPFAETKEYLAGFFLIDVANVEEAIEVAKQLPGSGRGTTEIRKVIELDHMPASNLK